MSNFLIMGVLSRFCFPLSWFFCWFARSRRTLLCMVVWKNYTIRRSVAHKSAKYMARIAGNSFISDSVSPAVRELLSSSLSSCFSQFSVKVMTHWRMKLNRLTGMHDRRKHHEARPWSSEQRVQALSWGWNDRFITRSSFTSNNMWPSTELWC